MAGRDYIKCDDCGCKLLYDGDDNGRERLEQLWGNPEASEWTVGLLCPDCLGKLRKRIASLEAEVERLRKLRDEVSAASYAIKGLTAQMIRDHYPRTQHQEDEEVFELAAAAIQAEGEGERDE